MAHLGIALHEPFHVAGADAEFVLEGMDLLPDRGVADVEGGRRRHEAAQPGRRAQTLELLHPIMLVTRVRSGSHWRAREV